MEIKIFDEINFGKISSNTSIEQVHTVHEINDKK